MSAFRVGQEVVCIRDDWTPADMDMAGITRPPMLNEILTISAVSDVESLQFEEIPRTSETATLIWVCWWAEYNFRPLVAHSQEQDVQMILSLLEPAGADA